MAEDAATKREDGPEPVEQEESGWTRGIAGVRKWNAGELGQHTSQQWSREAMLKLNELILSESSIEAVATRLKKSPAAVVNKLGRMRRKSAGLFKPLGEGSEPVGSEQDLESLWDRVTEGIRVWTADELEVVESRKWPTRHVIAISRAVVLQQLTLPQIAKKLGRTPGAIKSKLARMREKQPSLFTAHGRKKTGDMQSRELGDNVEPEKQLVSENQRLQWLTLTDGMIRWTGKSLDNFISTAWQKDTLLTLNRMTLRKKPFETVIKAVNKSTRATLKKLSRMQESVLRNEFFSGKKTGTSKREPEDKVEKLVDRGWTPHQLHLLVLHYKNENAGSLQNLAKIVGRSATACIRKHSRLGELEKKRLLKEAQRAGVTLPGQSNPKKRKAESKPADASGSADEPSENVVYIPRRYKVRKAEQKQLAPCTGRTWPPNSVYVLIEMYRTGYPYKFIAKSFMLSVSAVEVKLRRIFDIVPGFRLDRTERQKRFISLQPPSYLKS